MSVNLPNDIESTEQSTEKSTKCRRLIRHTFNGDSLLKQRLKTLGSNENTSTDQYPVSWGPRSPDDLSFLQFGSQIWQHVSSHQMNRNMFLGTVPTRTWFYRIHRGTKHANSNIYRKLQETVAETVTLARDTSFRSRPGKQAQPLRPSGRLMDMNAAQTHVDCEVRGFWGGRQQLEENKADASSAVCQTNLKSWNEK